MTLQRQLGIVGHTVPRLSKESNTSKQKEEISRYYNTFCSIFSMHKGFIMFEPLILSILVRFAQGFMTKGVLEPVSPTTKYYELPHARVVT